MAIIVKALEQIPDGASLEEIKRIAKLDLDVRHLQRRMDSLRNEGKITRSGRTRVIRYHLVKKESVRSEAGTKGVARINIPLSKEGEEVQALVSQYY